MPWDASRPVPWQRLAREWVIYVAVMGAVFVVFFRDRPLIGIFAGLLASGPLYLLLGYVLAKFGYRRRSLKELRAERSTATATQAGTGEVRPRPKPPPTKRTGGGGRPGGSRKRRR
jgi:hypothetical protein